VTALLLGGAPSARGEDLEVSPDTTTTLNSVVVDRRQPALDDGVSVTPTAIGPSSPGITLPNGANLDAFDRLASGEVVFSTDITVSVAGLPAPGIAKPDDVVLVAVGGPSLAFSSTLASLPAGTDIDAVGLEANADLLLSFDTTVSLGGTVADDEDVMRVDGVSGATSLAYDGSAQGLSTQTGLDLDGVYRDLDTGHLLLSFDGSGSVGGVPFDDEDVLDWDPTGGTYTLAYDGSAAPTSWPAGADLDAVSGFATDSDADGVPDASDNCDHEPNANQLDSGGVGLGVPPNTDGIGDACQCGDVNGDGKVLTNDATIILRSLLQPPTAVIAFPDKCDVGPSAGACNTADATIIRRALLVPPTLTVQQVCAAALP
jgi:hypothetical protein